MIDLKHFLRTVPDFPEKGVTFQWYGELIKDKRRFKQVIKGLARPFRHIYIDAIMGLDARGFIFGAALAYELEVGFIPLLKKGKIPPPTRGIEFEKEYGKDAFELEEGIIERGERIVIVDDLLATGGSFQAASKLVKEMNGIVLELACILELPHLKGREKLEDDLFVLFPTES